MGSPPDSLWPNMDDVPSGIGITAQCERVQHEQLLFEIGQLLPQLGTKRLHTICMAGGLWLQEDGPPRTLRLHVGDIVGGKAG